MEDPTLLLSFAEKMLLFTCLRPNQEKRLFSLFFYVYSSVMLISIVNFVYCCYCDPSYQLDLANVLEASLTIVQIFCRVMVLKIFKPKLHILITYLKSFKLSQICIDIDPASAIYITTKCRRLRYLAKTYSLFVALSMLAFLIGFLLDDKKQLILGGIVPAFNPFVYYFFIILQTFVVYLEIFLISGFDCCFAGLCLCFAVYFKIVACKFVMIGKITNEGELKSCVNSYSELREKFLEMTHIYNVFLLLQFCVSIGGCFVEMFFMLESSVANEIFSIVGFMFALFFQWSLYCLSAQEATEEALAVARSIYFCDWEIYNDSKINACVYLTIMLGQRPIFFSAAGIIKVDRAAMALVRTVFRQSLSILTLMRSLKQQN